jgi:hypothetical protein
MKEKAMTNTWRTVQLFLEDAGVFEVEINSENSSQVRCSCKAFNTSSRCKHSRFVKTSMANNNGHYTIQVPEDTPDEAAAEAMDSAESFRNFIIWNAKVEVID